MSKLIFSSFSPFPTLSFGLVFYLGEFPVLGIWLWAAKSIPNPGLAGEKTLAEAKPPEGREAYPRGTLPRQRFLTPFQSRYRVRVAGL